MESSNHRLAHLSSIDLLRGLAAIVVCLYHLTGGFLPENNIFRLFFSKGHLSVEIFFVISGFVIPFSMYQSGYKLPFFGRFMLKRLIRLEPPYWGSIAVVLGMDYFSARFLGYSPPAINWENISWHFLHLNKLLGKPWLIAIYWSLAIEIQYYLLIGLIYSFLMSEVKNIRFLTMFTFVGVSFFFAETNVFHFTPYFLVGILLFQYRLGLLKKNEFWGILTLVLAIIWVQEEFNNVLAMLLATSVILNVSRQNRLTQFLGNISYSMYLLHVPLAWSFVTYTLKYVKDTDFQRIILIFMSTIISILAAYLYYIVVEKPCLKYARKIKLKP